MSKIDTSTYKQIKKERKLKNKKYYDKGEYGHSKRYKNIRMAFTLVLFMLILTDVVFSLIIFQTRKTLFVIIGCVMAIPFARNLIDFFMALKADPLSKEEYDKVDALSKETGRKFLYDITITETEGVVYIPALAIYNNNIIAYTPKVNKPKDREKIKVYINEVNSEGDNYRIFVTEKFATFSKEIGKLRDASSETLERDEYITLKLLSMGF